MKRTKPLQRWRSRTPPRKAQPHKVLPHKVLPGKRPPHRAVQRPLPGPQGINVGLALDNRVYLNKGHEPIRTMRRSLPALLPFCFLAACDLMLMAVQAAEPTLSTLITSEQDRQNYDGSASYLVAAAWRGRLQWSGP
jgi:hypothetical protein